MDFIRKLWGDKETDPAPLPPEATSQGKQAVERPKTGQRQTAITRPLAQASEPAVEEQIQLNSEMAREDQEHVMPDQAEPDQQFEGLRVGYVSDVGQLRGHNEDTLVAFQGAHLGYDTAVPFGFFIVTDGMGGHQAGEVASSLAARLVAHEVLSRVYLPFLLDATPNADTKPLPEILSNAVEKASFQVHERVPGGGGTTLTCALIMGRRAYLAHVGDSRAYLLNGHEMRQLTRDHSFVNRLIELGELSPEEATVHPQRHVLYRAVGQRDQLEVDTYQQSLPPGSFLLICSDGLSGVVSEKEMGAIVAAAATPQQACQRLAEAANQAGGPDNITAVLIQMPST